MSVAATVAKRIMPLFDRVLVQVELCFIQEQINKLESRKHKLLSLLCNVVLTFSAQRAVAETKTKGGLLIPETAQKSPLEATVVAAGPGARNATTGL